jgi:hypothetical protein
MGNLLTKDSLRQNGHGNLDEPRKDASTHHLRMPLPSAFRIRGSLLVPLRYFIKCDIFFQPSVSGARTLVVRNAMDVQVSGLARLVEQKVFSSQYYGILSTCLSSTLHNRRR